MNSYERKLRKKAHKLAKWAKKNGIEHVAIVAIAPNDVDTRWFADATAYVEDARVASVSDFYKEDEL
jgi:hypothetical protein